MGLVLQSWVNQIFSMHFGNYYRFDFFAVWLDRYWYVTETVILANGK